MESARDRITVWNALSDVFVSKQETGRKKFSFSSQSTRLKGNLALESWKRPLPGFRIIPKEDSPFIQSFLSVDHHLVLRTTEHKIICDILSPPLTQILRLMLVSRKRRELRQNIEEEEKKKYLLPRVIFLENSEVGNPDIQQDNFWKSYDEQTLPKIRFDLY